jgi:Fe-S cluster assembly protein SufD
MKKRIRIKNRQEKIIPFVWFDQTTEIDLHIELIGEGSSVHIVGLFIGKESKHISFNTTVVHKASNTKSRTTIRGVFLDNSSFTNDGMICIEKGATGSDGFFSSKILLFDNAKGRSVPSLEIDENDLKAGHGSTVGKPDEEQIFYLQSRGLSEKEAEKLIVSGFFEPVISLLSSIQMKQVRKKIASII